MAKEVVDKSRNCEPDIVDSVYMSLYGIELQCVIADRSQLDNPRARKLLSIGRLPILRRCCRLCVKVVHFEKSRNPSKVRTLRSY